MKYSKDSLNESQYLLPIHDAIVKKIDINPEDHKIIVLIYNIWTKSNEVIECNNYCAFSTTAAVIQKSQNERLYGALIEKHISDDKIGHYSHGYINMGIPYKISKEKYLSLLINWMSGDYMHAICEEVNYSKASE